MTKMHMANWTKMTTVIGGTNNITLGPVTGFPQVAETVGTGKSFYYAFLNINLSPIEIGKGIMLDSITLQRDAVEAAYISNALVTDGTKANIPVGAIMFTAPTANMLQDLIIEMSLQDLGSISGANTVPFDKKALKMHLTGNATLTFDTLPPAGVKAEMTLEVTSATHPTNSPATGFSLGFAGASFIYNAAAAPAFQTKAAGLTRFLLTTIDAGATFHVTHLSEDEATRNLGNIAGNLVLDIRHAFSVGFLTGAATLHTITDIDPDVAFGRAAHFTLLNTGSVAKTLRFNPDLISIAGSTLFDITLPIGYKADFDIRRNPVNPTVSYEAKVGDVNYNQTASGLATSWNPSDRSPNIILDPTNKTASITAAGVIGLVRAFGGKSAGKHAFVLRCDQLVAATTTSNSPQTGIGVTTLDLATGMQLGSTLTSYAAYFRPRSSGAIIGTMNNNVVTSGVANLATYPVLGEIWRVLVDLDANKIWWARNNLVIGGGNPEAGTGQSYNLQPDIILFPAASLAILNVGQPGIWTILNEMEDPFAAVFPSFINWTS